jgi:hypothetical protein
MRNILFALACCLIIACSCPSQGLAKSVQSWPQAKVAMEKELSQNLKPDKRCQIIWNTLWYWSKKGNVEARAELLLDFYNNGRRMPRASESIRDHVLF